jgi:hypothetical protein
MDICVCGTAVEFLAILYVRMLIPPNLKWFHLAKADAARPHGCGLPAKSSLDREAPSRMTGQKSLGPEERASRLYLVAAPISPYRSLRPDNLATPRPR